MDKYKKLTSNKKMKIKRKKTQKGNGKETVEEFLKDKGGLNDEDLSQIKTLMAKYKISVGVAIGKLLAAKKAAEEKNKKLKVKIVRRSAFDDNPEPPMLS